MLGAGSQVYSFHIESHAALLQQPVGAESPGKALDAIIVPTIRPQSVQVAAKLAGDVGSALVVLCSTPEQAERAQSECQPNDGDTLITYVPESLEAGLLSFLTSGHPELEIASSCHDDIARKRNAGLLLALSVVCHAHQVRAASEEFGDLIAEGLYRLLHQGAGLAEADYDYWRGALERRLQLIDHVAARLLRQDGEVPMIGSALMSLAAARRRLSLISALSRVSFVHVWRTDLDVWRHRLSALPEVGDLAGAAKFLELPAPESCVRR